MKHFDLIILSSVSRITKHDDINLIDSKLTINNWRKFINILRVSVVMVCRTLGNPK